MTAVLALATTHIAILIVLVLVVGWILYAIVNMPRRSR